MNREHVCDLRIVVEFIRSRLIKRGDMQVRTPIMIPSFTPIITPMMSKRSPQTFDMLESWVEGYRAVLRVALGLMFASNQCVDCRLPIMRYAGTLRARQHSRAHLRDCDEALARELLHLDRSNGNLV